MPEAGAIGIIGGADGPTAIFLSSKLANGTNIYNGVQVKNLIGPIAIAAYSYMALVPVIQPPIMKLLTNKKERAIHMKPPRSVTRLEKILFPVIGLLLTGFISPSALPLLGMLFFGNLLKESGVTKRLAETARTSLIDIVTILLGLTVGASTQADVFLTDQSILIFILGAFSFMIATAGGVIFAKVMNLFLKDDNRINPLVGAAGVSTSVTPSTGSTRRTTLTGSACFTFSGGLKTIKPGCSLSIAAINRLSISGGDGVPVFVGSGVMVGVKSSVGVFVEGGRVFVGSLVGDFVGCIRVISGVGVCEG